MTPNERITAIAPGGLREVRDLLGEFWGIGRRLTQRELAMALGLGGADPGRSLFHLERHPDKITGPVSVAILAFLNGFVPDGAPAGAAQAMANYNIDYKDE